MTSIRSGSRILLTTNPAEPANTHPLPGHDLDSPTKYAAIRPSQSKYTAENSATTRSARSSASLIAVTKFPARRPVPHIPARSRPDRSMYESVESVKFSQQG
jgi:hypothetical protein